MTKSKKTKKIFRKDRASMYVWCNEAYAKDLNIKPEDIAGRGDYDFYPKKLAEKYIADDKRVLEKGIIIDTEEEYEVEGRKGFVQTIKVPIRGEQGDISGLIGMFWDITDEKKIQAEREKRIRESKEIMDQVISVLQKVAMGDFSENLNIPEEENDYTELLVAMNLMIDDLKELNQEMEEKIKDRTKKLAEEVDKVQKAELKIKASQQMLQNVINLLPVRVFWKDNNLRYLGCNIAFARDAGFSNPEEIIGKDDFQMVWRNEAESYRDDDMKVLKNKKEKRDYEEQQTTPSGDVMWLLTSKVPLTDNDGDTIGVLGTYSDITDKREREISLKRMASIIEESQDAIISKDLKGNILTWNQGAEKMYGYKKEEVIGKSVDILIPEGHKSDLKKILDKIKKGEKIKNYETIRCNKNQEKIIVSLTISPVKKGRDEIVAASVIARDITYKKKYENELKEKVDELERINKLMVGRELRMVELKNKIKELKAGRVEPKSNKSWIKKFNEAVELEEEVIRQLQNYIFRQINDSDLGIFRKNKAKKLLQTLIDESIEHEKLFRKLAKYENEKRK